MKKKKMMITSPQTDVITVGIRQFHSLFGMWTRRP
jgi:hypothetical protein